jgi:hypothetical protein
MTHRVDRSRRQLLRDAVVTLAAVLLAFAAFDDITTDRDTDFTFEWGALSVCALWLALVSWRLLKSEPRWLGVISVTVLVAAAGTGSRIRANGPFPVEYLTTIAGLLWFLGLAGFLAAQAWRRGDTA